MSEPQEVRAPDYVPGELITMYRAGAPEHRGEYRGRRAVGPAAIGRAERWTLGTSMACCIAMVAAILIALVAATSSPMVAGAGLLAILLIAAVVARAIVRAMQRDQNDTQRPASR